MKLTPPLEKEKIKERMTKPMFNKVGEVKPLRSDAKDMDGTIMSKGK